MFLYKTVYKKKYIYQKFFKRKMFLLKNMKHNGASYASVVYEKCLESIDFLKIDVNYVENCFCYILTSSMSNF